MHTGNPELWKEFSQRNKWSRNYRGSLCREWRDFKVTISWYAGGVYRWTLLCGQKVWKGELDCSTEVEAMQDVGRHLLLLPSDLRERGGEQLPGH